MTAQLNVISMTRFLRNAKGWPFLRALELARTVRELATGGVLPSGETVILPEGPGATLTIRELEIAGGVVRLTLVPLTSVTLA